MNIQQVDALDWVRANQTQFFATGRANLMGLLAYVMSDVLELGRGECRIAACELWWIVSSNVDWMLHPTIPVADLFERVALAPEHGEHSVRAEVLLNAFATDVVTESAGARTLVKGVAPEDHLIRAALDAEWVKRFVAFRL
jgi:hypothetical protein